MHTSKVISRTSDEALDNLKGKVPAPGIERVRLVGPSKMLRPDGSLLCVYVPGALAEVLEGKLDALSSIRMETGNRSQAGGAQQVVAGSSRTRHIPIYSGIMGAMDAVAPSYYCRLTAFTAQKLEQWDELLPVWQRMAGMFEEHVPDRFQVQSQFARRTQPEWIIKGTPFTTITINNTYPTGVHTDKGDLDEGFSCLAVARRGNFTGGHLTFPRYRIGVDMRHGDMILMDAHEWHANTPIICGGCEHELKKPCDDCGTERISLVAYYRTAMQECGDASAEAEKKVAYGERRLTVAEEVEEDKAAVTTTS